VHHSLYAGGRACYPFACPQALDGESPPGNKSRLSLLRRAPRSATGSCRSAIGKTATTLIAVVVFVRLRGPPNTPIGAAGRSLFLGTFLEAGAIFASVVLFAITGAGSDEDAEGCAGRAAAADRAVPAGGAHVRGRVMGGWSKLVLYCRRCEAWFTDVPHTSCAPCDCGQSVWFHRASFHLGCGACGQVWRAGSFGARCPAGHQFQAHFRPERLALNTDDRLLGTDDQVVYVSSAAGAFVAGRPPGDDAYGAHHGEAGTPKGHPAEEYLDDLLRGLMNALIDP
jgi:hypothetical protein